MPEQKIETFQVPYAPYRMAPSKSGGRILNPATGKHFTLNHHAVNVIKLCDGWHTVEEVTSYISSKSKMPHEKIKAIICPLMTRWTEDGLIWWRNERVRFFKPPPPQIVYFDITKRCNLMCRHCGVDAGLPLEDELSHDECIYVIDQLARAGVDSVVFSGGEPLMHDNFFKLIKHTKQSGLTVEISTNATLLDKHTAILLRDTVDHVQVSLDGSNPNIHDDLRGCRGAFEKALNGVGHLREAGVPFIVGCVIHKNNLKDLEEIAGLAASIGAESLRIIHFVPFGRGREFRYLETSPKDLIKLALKIRDIRCSGVIDISEVNFEHLFDKPVPISEQELQGPLSCGGGWSSVTITPTGEVLPCSAVSGLRGDNLRDKTFLEIWENSRLLNYWRSIRVSDIKGKCKSCQWLSQCKGGCPAANFSHNMMFEPNVQCCLSASEASSGDLSVHLWHPA